jgi:hypothetical protein
MTVVIGAESHCDHGLTQEQLRYVLGQFTEDGVPGGQPAIVREVELPPELGLVPCALHGPIMGQPPVRDDEVTMRPRGPRPWPSRLVGRPAQWTNRVTAVVGPHTVGTQEHPMFLYTVYGGPEAPREPGSPGLAGQHLQEAVEFWSVHALAAGDPPVK